MRDRIKIQKAITDLVRRGTFWRVDYVGEEPQRGAPVPEEELSVIANELRCSWKPSRDKTQPGLQERAVWAFLARVEVRGEALFEDFEDDFAGNPQPVELNEGRTVWLSLIEADYDHPPRQQSAGNSRATYTIEVTTS